MEFTSELIQVLSKRAWKLSWILVLNSIISISIIIFIVLNQKIYISANFVSLKPNYISLITFFANSSLTSIVLFFVFFALKGDSDMTIHKLREKFYNKAIERVKLVFQYRYNFPSERYIDDIKILTQYAKEFTKKDKKHIVKIENLNSVIVDGIDSLYITYKINDEEKILFSIWHSGAFIAIAIAIEQKILICEESIVNNKFENTLNLTGSQNENENKLSLRDGYWWFDIKYETNDEFLSHNVDQEQIARKIAHIVTLGISASMELLQWQKVK